MRPVPKKLLLVIIRKIFIQIKRVYIKLLKISDSRRKLTAVIVYLNHFLDSSNYYYATNTDYVNLGELQRVTAGLGYRSGKWYADMAYQYQMQKADVYAFHLPEGSNNMTNRLQAAKVDLNRHNVQFTVGYKF
jgi:hypothetical protein